MAINVADNFSYKGGKPLDARTKYATVADMVATPTADLYDGCLAYVTDTKKNYQYDSSNESIEIYGKWRELQTGGGGGSYSAGDGIDIANDVISTEKSQSGDIEEIVDIIPTAGRLVSIVNAFNKGDIYNTEERMIGQWTNGKPLYAKTFYISSLPNSTTVEYSLDVSNVEYIAEVTGVARVYDSVTNENIIRPLPYIASSSIGLWTDTKNGVTVATIYTTSDRSDHEAYIMLKYTKTTDVAISIGEATEYSTDEKIIGTWVDGKPLYQKTIIGTISSLSNIEFTPIGATIDKVASIQGIAFVNGQASLLPFFNDAMNVKVALTVNTDSVSSDKNSVFCYATGTSSMVGQPYFATLQYTKTTT